MRLIMLLALMMLSISPSVAFDDAEIMTYASGVLAATDADALPIINDTILIIGREASEYEIQNPMFAAYKAEKLAEAAYTVATHFPGRFRQAMGLLTDIDRLGEEPFVGCMITIV
jgi:hypothetical protein